MFLGFSFSVYGNNIEKKGSDKSQDQIILGKWECTFSGYESIISLYQIGNKFFTIIDFTKNNSRTKKETLQKKGKKYFVVNSTANEYYIINNDGNLELWDKEGLFTTAKSIMPDKKSKPKFDINKSIGQNVFTVRGNYSKSLPETLDGTDNNYWIVYFKDLNVTFKVEKKTDRIIKGREGKVPKMN
ncbi:hypothetical protein PbJCM13498_04380 [Prolixibacter bellariivorans]|uniref:Uncharacterized protein n=2 Tax=Prolixibacter bellariivorans TaxID=314319 RepID=A0A5M4AUF7_9BACT|nr:hypothetical protein PbJCM13498_04380 [Prolixibacter bellariivorans]